MAEADKPADLHDPFESRARFEPDAVLVDDADRRDRDTEDARRQHRDPIERAIRGRVQDVVATYCGESLRRGVLAEGAMLGHRVGAVNQRLAVGRTHHSLCAACLPRAGRESEGRHHVRGLPGAAVDQQREQNAVDRQVSDQLGRAE